jgi:hypothetical protein
MARYFLLLARDGAGKPWRLEFGDYDRGTVDYERQTYRDNGTRAGNLKIICSNSARQSCVDYCVDFANGKFDDPEPKEGVQL